MGSFSGAGLPGATGATGATGPVSNVTGAAPVTSTGGATPAIGITAATTLAAGSMSAADKVKLNALPTDPVTSISVNAPLTTTGGATPVLDIDNATPGVDGAMSGADKTRLDAMPDPPLRAVYVFTDADLPAPVADVITLASSTVYHLMDVITLPVDTRIEIPSSSAVVAELPGNGSIIGDVNDAVVTVTGGTPGHGYMSYIKIENQHSSTSSCALRVNEATAELSLFFVGLIAPGIALDLLSVEHATVISAHMLVSELNGTVVKIGAAGFVDIEISHIEVSGANSIGIHMPSTANVPNLTVERCTFIFDATSQFGIVKHASATATYVNLVELIAEGAAATMNSGWDQATPGWRTVSVDTLTDSQVVGAVYVASAFTCPISTQNVYQLIAPTVGTPWTFNTESERFALTSAASGEINFTDVHKRKCLITGSISLSKSGTTVAVTLALFKNGVLIPGSEVPADVTTSAFAHACTAIASLEATDVISLRIKNTTNTNSLSVSGGSVNAITSVLG